MHSRDQLRGHHAQPGADAPTTRPPPHLLLALQRNAGNRAATVVAQRRKDDFKESFLTHIFRGEPNDQATKVAGFHSEHQADSAMAYVDSDTPRNGGGQGGIYSAKPVKAHGTRGKVKGKLLGDKTDGSTFFPRSWTPEQVKKVIESGQIQSGDGEGRGEVQPGRRRPQERDSADEHRREDDLPGEGRRPSRRAQEERGAAAAASERPSRGGRCIERPAWRPRLGDTSGGAVNGRALSRPGSERR